MEILPPWVTSFHTHIPYPGLISYSYYSLWNFNPNNSGNGSSNSRPKTVAGFPAWNPGTATLWKWSGIWQALAFQRLCLPFSCPCRELPQHNGEIRSWKIVFCLGDLLGFDSWLPWRRCFGLGVLQPRSREFGWDFSKRCRTRAWDPRVRRCFLVPFNGKWGDLAGVWMV